MLMDRTIVIAEIGENHLGNMAMAVRMIDEAAGAGADIVKFQSYRSIDVSPDDPERDWFAQVELTEAHHRDLQRAAAAAGVEFLSAPFSVERAILLCERLGLCKLKIGSSEMTNAPLLQYVNGRVDDLFLSTGLATLDEVRAAVAHLTRVPRLHLLHCVSLYPTSDADANLRAIEVLRQAFPQCRVGYSDHTVGIDAVCAAVALGATVVEKHFTLGKTLPGTDHVISADPPEFAEMVRRIRRIEVLLGRREKAPVAGELEARELVRRRWRKDAVGAS